MELPTLTPIDDAVYTIKEALRQLKLEHQAMEAESVLAAGIEKLELGVQMIQARDVVSRSIKKLQHELAALAKLIPPRKINKGPVVLINPWTDQPFQTKTNQRRKR